MHEVSRTDYYMGQLRTELKRQGIEKDTYIIYMTDNGRRFRVVRLVFMIAAFVHPSSLRGPAPLRPQRRTR